MQCFSKDVCVFIRINVCKSQFPSIFPSHDASGGKWGSEVVVSQDALYWQPDLYGFINVYYDLPSLKLT